MLDPLLILAAFLPLIVGYVAGPPPEEFWGDLMSQTGYVAWTASHPWSLAGSWFPPSSVPLWEFWPSPAIPIYAIFYASTGDPWIAVKAVQLLELGAAVFGAYYLAKQLGVKRFGCVVTTLAFVTAPFFQTQMVQHPFNAMGYALLPTAYFALIQYFRERKFGQCLFAGIAVASVLVSSPSAVFFLVLPLVTFCVVYSLTRKTSADTRSPLRIDSAPKYAMAYDLVKRLTRDLILSLFPLVLGVLFSAFYLWPTAFDQFPYRQTVAGYPRPLWYGGDLVSLLTFQYFEMIPFMRDPIPWTFVLVPLATVGLAVVGALHTRLTRDPIRLGLVVAGGLAFSLSFASPELASPFLFLRDFLPGFGYLRTPDRFLPTAILSLSVLAGTGASVALDRCRRIEVRREHRAFPTVIFPRIAGDRRGLVLPLVLVVLLVLPFVFVFYTQNNIFFLGAFRNTPYGSTIDSYKEIQQWIKDHYRANTRILDLTDVGENQLHTLDLPALVYPGRSLIRQFAYSSQLPSLLCRLGIGFVIIPATNFSGTEERQAYFFLNGSELYQEHRLGLFEVSAVDLVEHRAPPKMQEVSVFESKAPCDSTYAGRVMFTLGGPRTILVSNGRFPSDVPLALSGDPGSRSLESLSRATDALVLDDPTLIDLGMRIFGTSKPLSEYAAAPWERVVLEGGFQQVFGQLVYQSFDGYLVLADNAITASERGASLNVHFEITSPEKYAVVVRILGSDNGEILTATIDSHVTSTINTDAWRGFRWIVLSNDTMLPGLHTLTIKKAAERLVTLDSVSIMPWEDWSAFRSKTAAFVEQQHIPVAFAINPAWFAADASGGQSLALSESLSLSNWALHGNQTLRISSDAGAPVSPVLDWDYSSGQYGYVDLILSRHSIDLDSTLQIWLRGTGAEQILTFWLLFDNGTFVDYDIGLTFEGWQKFNIPLSEFGGLWAGPLNITALRIIPSRGNGSTSIGGLMFRSAPRVVPSLDSPSGQLLELPPKSSVTFSYTSFGESDESMELVFEDQASPNLLVCEDMVACQRFTGLSDGLGRMLLTSPDGPHDVTISNEGETTQKLQYVWIAEPYAASTNPITNSSVRIQDEGYRIDLVTTAPVAIMAGESFDPGWTAVEGDTKLTSFFDGLWSIGFVVVEPGSHTIYITHSPSVAQITGKIVSSGTLVLAIGWYVGKLGRTMIRRRLSLNDGRGFKKTHL